MGKKSKRKGYYGEWKLVKLLRDHGIEAKRVPYSGATEDYKGDVMLPHSNELIEVKLRNDSFKTLYDWLNGMDYLAIKRDKQDFLIVMELDKFIDLYRRANYRETIMKKLKR